MSGVWIPSREMLAIELKRRVHNSNTTCQNYFYRYKKIGHYYFTKKCEGSHFGDKNKPGRFFRQKLKRIDLLCGYLLLRNALV